MRLVSVLAFLTLGALVGCGGEADSGKSGASNNANHEVLPPADPEDVGVLLATVGDAPIGSNAFQAAAARKAPSDGVALSGDEKKEVLDKLIVEEVLYQEAARRGLYRDPKVRKIMVNLLLREEVYGNVRNSDFTQEELKKYFEAHRDEFVVPEKVQIKRILIKSGGDRPAKQAKALANDLRSQIAGNPLKFKDIASEYSEDPYKRRGGDLGYVSREGKPGIDQAVIDKAFELDTGAVSEVFEAGGGFNIVLVANRREQVERTFEQMKGSVLRKLKNERYKDLTDSYVDNVRGNYAIDINDANLANVDVKSAGRLSMDRGKNPPFPGAKGAKGKGGAIARPKGKGQPKAKGGKAKGKGKGKGKQ